jgi:hypothetical protein
VHDRRTAFTAQLAHSAADASSAIAAAARAAVHLSVAFNHATATRGDDLPFVDVGATPASAPPGTQRVGLMVGALRRANPQPFSVRRHADARGRSIMKIWLTVAEASLYSGARKEREHGDGC